MPNDARQPSRGESARKDSAQGSPVSSKDSSGAEAQMPRSLSVNPKCSSVPWSMQQVQNPPWSFFDEAQLIDISPPISPALAVWPGDEPPARLVQLDMERGDNLTLSSLHSTVHLGAHADAPLHYAKGGADIANCSLHYYFGPCQVISVDVKKGSRVMPEHVSVPLRAPRVLFRTLSYPDPHQFNDDFSALSSDLIDVLKKNHVLLVGIDTPSVDLAHDAALQTHQALARADMAVLEGLVLAHVPDGLYRLMAFPLPLVGFDASPVRAVLQTNVSV